MSGFVREMSEGGTTRYSDTGCSAAGAAVAGAGAIAAMSAGLNHGFKRGYFMTFGLILGILTQVLFVSAGLGALIAASETAFAFIKWAGVAYLVWLGIQASRSPARPIASAGTPMMSLTPGLT